VDFIALSFVREAADVELLRTFLKERGSLARIVAKIEDQSAIDNLDDIIRATDALMVCARRPRHRGAAAGAAVIQRRAVRTCLAIGRPVIIATHMLESMISQPMPSRAEITDVANAVYEQADCVMLSGETTVGKYPLEVRAGARFDRPPHRGGAGWRFPGARGVPQRPHEGVPLRGDAGQRAAAFAHPGVHAPRHNAAGLAAHRPPCAPILR